MMSLNETYEKEIKMRVHFVNIPSNALITSGDTDSVMVTVSDKGFNILPILYSSEVTTIDVDFTRYQSSDGTGTISGSELRHLIEKQLPTSTKIISMKTGSLVFYYNNGEKKKVPVVLKGHPVPAQRYFIAKTIIRPDSVTIYASHDRLDSISAVFTEEQNYDNFHDTLTVESRLEQMLGVKMEPSQVSVTFLTDVLTEERIDNIPITGINMPDGKVLRTFPAKVSVSVVAGMKTLRAIAPSDFIVVADYNQIASQSSDKCDITLQHIPAGISKATLTVSSVDYLIEGNDK